MALCPDFSDSEDSDFSDDIEGYYNFKQKIKDINAKNQKSRLNQRALTKSEENEQRIRSLYSFICSGNKQGVIELLDSGLDINTTIYDNWNPLLLAVSFGNLELTEILLKRGADANCARAGCTALMMACNCPMETSPFEVTLNIVKMLIEFKVDPKTINRKRMTALMFAASNGHLEAVKYLLPLSNKTAEDNQKWTALFWAVNGNHTAVVKYLLDQGFLYNITDVRNNCPADIARHNNCTEILDFFPVDEENYISAVIGRQPNTLQEISNLKYGQMPKFLPDIYNMLSGVRCESAIKTIDENEVTLYEFLTMTEDELEKLGIDLPFQRHRILGGIYKFHKYPFHPNSLYVVPLSESYSNLDVTAQLMSIIKQMTVMQAAILYLEKNCSLEKMSKEEKAVLLKNITSLRSKLKMCKMVITKLKKKTVQWDHCVKPPDLITAKSRGYHWPWRKMIFTFSVISLIIVFKIRK